MDKDNHLISTPNPRAGWGRRVLFGGVVLAALAGVGVATAVSSDFGRGHGMGGYGMRAGMGADFAEYRLEKMLESIQATPEQTEKVKSIFGSARDELLPMAESLRGTREEVARILAAPTLDRAAAETLRSVRVAALDTASRRITTALLDVADVLTPEQRAKLVEHFKERGLHRP